MKTTFEKAKRVARGARRKQQGQTRRLLPYVIVNMAMTADGKIATANRAVSSFGSRFDRRHLLELRATADAVMAGARTADLNVITMGPGPAKYRRMRVRQGLAEYNLRIIVSRSGTVNPEAKVFKHLFSPIIVLTTRAAGSGRLKTLSSLANEIKTCGKDRLDLAAGLAWLREKWKVKRLVCEGGGELNDALFRAGLVDELHLTICPLIFGGREAPTIADGLGAPNLAAATPLECQSARRVGEEMFFVFRRWRRRS